MTLKYSCTHGIGLGGYAQQTLDEGHAQHAQPEQRPVRGLEQEVDVAPLHGLCGARDAVKQ